MSDTKPTFHAPPPWTAFPEHKHGSLFWKMGAGEGFLKEWINWICGLTPEEREQYLREQQAPPRWRKTVERTLEMRRELGGPLPE